MHDAETPQERRADLAVHVLGLDTVAVGASLLAVKSASLTSGPSLFRVCLYIAGLVAAIGCSALYHIVTRPDWKQVLRRLDHAAVFVMIAGTYTALASITVHTLSGFFVLGVV